MNYQCQQTLSNYYMGRTFVITVVPWMSAMRAWVRFDASLYVRSHLGEQSTASQQLLQTDTISWWSLRSTVSSILNQSIMVSVHGPMLINDASISGAGTSGIWPKYDKHLASFI
jgi:hypothetical protein